MSTHLKVLARRHAALDESTTARASPSPAFMTPLGDMHQAVVAMYDFKCRQQDNDSVMATPSSNRELLDLQSTESIADVNKRLVRERTAFQLEKEMWQTKLQDQHADLQNVLQAARELKLHVLEKQERGEIPAAAAKALSRKDTQTPRDGGAPTQDADTTALTKQETSPSGEISTARRATINISTHMSDSIFDHLLGRGREVDMVQAVKESPRSRDNIRFSVMDSSVEYWDQDGMIRRSATITKRMNLRGIPVPNALDVDAYLKRVNENIPDRHETSPPSPTKAQVDGAVAATVGAKKNHIKQVDDALLRSLQECYKPPSQTNKLALVETKHTAVTPSKLLQYVDHDGNIRQMRRAGHDTPLSEPPPPTPNTTPVGATTVL
ncbi:hypothetical protein AC1031_016919 [Aphanomyces cochlioides]|nr:hypothetical protein AC1031_016919 [Aphanomyces cochlioides]